MKTLEGLVWAGEDHKPCFHNFQRGIITAIKDDANRKIFTKHPLGGTAEELANEEDVSKWIGVRDGIIALKSFEVKTNSGKLSHYRSEVYHIRVDGKRTKIYEGLADISSPLNKSQTLSSCDDKIILQQSARPRIGNIIPWARANFDMRQYDEIIIIEPGKKPLRIHSGTSIMHSVTEEGVVVEELFKNEYSNQKSILIKYDGTKVNLSREEQPHNKEKISSKPFKTGMLYSSQDSIYFCEPTYNWERRKIVDKRQYSFNSWDNNKDYFVIARIKVAPQVKAVISSGGMTARIFNPVYRIFDFLSVDGNDGQMELPAATSIDWRAYG